MRTPSISLPSASSPASRPAWSTAWPDALAFAGGLVVAGLLGWQTTNLVWSLWLSSLVVGYASMAWPAVRTAQMVIGTAWRHWSQILPRLAEGGVVSALLVIGVGAIVGLGIAAFMTLHFVGFHVIHATALAGIFPPEGVTMAWSSRGMVHAFGELLQRYWIILPSAFIAGRTAFTTRSNPTDDGSVTAAAIEARKRRHVKGMVTGPYRNVFRMHCLIFFFVIAHLAGVTSAVVYVVVYAAYFFPWRIISSRTSPVGTPPAVKVC